MVSIVIISKQPTQFMNLNFIDDSHLEQGKMTKINSVQNHHMIPALNPSPRNLSNYQDARQDLLWIPKLDEEAFLGEEVFPQRI